MVMRRPNGPARLGPIRVCMSATTLRSTQITTITVSSIPKNTTTTRAASRIQSTRSI